MAAETGIAPKDLLDPPGLADYVYEHLREQAEEQQRIQLRAKLRGHG